MATPNRPITVSNLGLAARWLGLLTLLLLFAPASSGAAPQKRGTKPGARSTPKPIKSPPRPAPKRSKQQILDRKSGSPDGSTPPTPSGTGPAGPGVGKGPAAPKVVLSAADRKAGTRALDEMKRRVGRLRDEQVTGSILFIDKRGTRSEVPFRLIRRREKDGGSRVLLSHGRPGDLPSVALLGVMTPDGKAMWTRYSPEDRRLGAMAAGREHRIDGSALALGDFFLPTQPRFGLTLRESTISDGKRAYLFDAVARDTGAMARVTVRPDIKMTSRIEYVRSDGTATRRVAYSNLEYVGVHRRWKSWVVRDVGAESTAIVKVKSVLVNRGTKADDFTPDGLDEFLAVGPR